jgi:GxxExxY protein
MQCQKLTEQIIGCAFRVYNTLGFGFLESVYQKCMKIELAKAALKVDAQYPITVKYDDIVVGKFIADLYVEDAVIVEIKAVRAIARVHEVQLVNYLVATNVDVGVLLNFGEQKVDVKRKLRSLE